MATASAAMAGTGSTVSGGLDSPIPGTSKRITRRLGNCWANGVHMSVLPPRPVMRSSGSPWPVTFTWTRCLRHDTNSGSMGLPSRRGEEVDRPLPQPSSGPSGHDPHVPAGKPKHFRVRHDLRDRIHPFGRGNQILLRRHRQHRHPDGGQLYHAVADLYNPGHEPVTAWPELLVHLRQESAWRGHNVIHPGGHRPHVAQTRGRVVQTLPKIGNAPDQAVRTWRQHLEPALDLGRRHEPRGVVALTRQPHAVSHPANAAL